MERPHNIPRYLFVHVCGGVFIFSRSRVFVCAVFSCVVVVSPAVPGSDAMCCELSWGGMGVGLLVDRERLGRQPDGTTGTYNKTWETRAPPVGRSVVVV